MQIDPEHLRRHYASLSDEALLEIDRADLVDVAKQCYDDELARRELAPRGSAFRPRMGDGLPLSHPSGEEPEVDEEPPGDGDNPGWLEDAAEVYSQVVRHGTTPAGEAAHARDVLDAAGIPCCLELCEEPPEKPRPPEPLQRLRLLVPGGLNLRATSVLEREIFNLEFEAEWRNHLGALSDEQLREMTPRVAFGGLIDRIERAARVYEEELVRRKLK